MTAKAMMMTVAARILAFLLAFICGALLMKMHYPFWANFLIAIIFYEPFRKLVIKFGGKP